MDQLLVINIRFNLGVTNLFQSEVFPSDFGGSFLVLDLLENKGLSGVDRDEKDKK